MSLKISLLFFIAFAALRPISALAEVGDPNPGPRSNDEARVLFEEGKESLLKKDFKQASRDLKRLVERYPTFPEINDAYLNLLSSQLSDRNFSELLKYGQELILRRPDESFLNRARAVMAEASLNLKQYLNARTLAAEILEHRPLSKQKALAHSIRFQSYLEDKQYLEAQTELDLLRDFLEKEPNEVFQKLIPGFKMSLLTRQCIISHLLKDKIITDDEMLDYFSKKNLCFKSAIPEAGRVENSTILEDWCESFTFFNHELQKLKVDRFLKDKVASDLKVTFDFAKGIQPDLVKCYAPYAPTKSKKRHRKSSHQPSRSH